MTENLKKFLVCGAASPRLGNQPPHPSARARCRVDTKVPLSLRKPSPRRSIPPRHLRYPSARHERCCNHLPTWPRHLRVWGRVPRGLPAADAGGGFHGAAESAPSCRRRRRLLLFSGDRWRGAGATPLQSLVRSPYYLFGLPVGSCSRD